jgi:hypothetical protein
MKRSIFERMDPSCLTAGRPSAFRQEVLHV